MEFRCADSKALVRASNVRATLDAFKLMPSLGDRVVRNHKLPPDALQPDKMVPVQSWLNALSEIHSALGGAILRTVGTRIIENADFPPQFNSVESVLLALDQIYHLNHTGDVGHYIARKREDGSVEVHCETPYPRQFERGLVEGIARHRRLTQGRRYSVRYIDGAPDSERTCTLVVRETA
jgi:hypothetical protein